jgi:rod shape-determining protein MreB and related proteins
MGIFNFWTQDIAIDLGTANFLVIQDERIVLDEPSVLAYNRNSGKVIAIGRKAMDMDGKAHEGIQVVRPLKDGVIADYHAAEHMIKGMLRMISEGGKRFISSSRMVICVPCGTTDVEKRAVRDSAEFSGAKEVILIPEPIAAAVGIGLNVEEPTGHMIIDIGGGITEIAVIALSGIVCDQSLRVAGDNFDQDIIDYLRGQHNVLVGPSTAERIKIEVGAAWAELDNPPPDMAIKGRDLMTGLPKQVVVSHVDIAECLDRTLTKIEDAVLKTLELTPPELSADIHQSGIYLTGGSALLRGLDKRIAAKTNVPTHLVDEPLRAVVRGTSIALRNLDRFNFLLR